MGRIAAIMFMFGLAGCADTHYVRPDASAQQVAADQQACNYEAQKSTAMIEDTVDAVVKFINISTSCMHLKGYEEVAG